MKVRELDRTINLPTLIRDTDKTLKEKINTDKENLTTDRLINIFSFYSIGRQPVLLNEVKESRLSYRLSNYLFILILYLVY